MTTAAAVLSPEEAVGYYWDEHVKHEKRMVEAAANHINEALKNPSGSAEFDVMDGDIIRWSGAADGSILPIRVVGLHSALEALKASNRSYKLETRWVWLWFLGLVPVWPQRIQVLKVNR